MLSIIGSLFVGAYAITPNEVVRSILAYFDGGVQAKEYASVHYLLFSIRLPRIFLAVIVGSGLSAAGAAIQGLFRNPLADPTLIGITSGGMLFAVAGIVLTNSILAGWSNYVGYYSITILAFIGSLLTTIFVYQLATKGNRTHVTTMLLAGIAITALAGAGTGLITYYSSEAELRDITFWTLGSLTGANWQVILTVAPLVLVAVILLYSIAGALDIFLLGEKEANYLGVNTQRVKWIVIGSTALAVGACVAVSGIISFVALVIPHIVRLINGPKHKKLIINSAFLGGILLLSADAFARTVIAPAELPIGIITALLGAPFFLWMLVKAKGKNTFNLA